MDTKNRLELNFFTGNQLKILALLTMTCDHVGKQLLPQYPILQIIGRLAFPIFAYMIAEGCKYTKNRKRYLGTMAGMALICQIVYAVAMGSLYQCVLVTFSLSILLIYALDYAVENSAGRQQESGLENNTKKVWLVPAVVFAGIAFISICLPKILSHTDFMIDYGIWGILLPVLVYMADTRQRKLLMIAAGLSLLAISLGGIQWYSLLSLIVLFLYNGKRGKARLKNIFYIYYPLHLVVIYVISLIV